MALMFSTKEKLNINSLRQLSAQSWIVIGWNILAVLFVLVAVIVLVLGIRSNHTTVPGASKRVADPAADAPLADQTIESSWVAFDAYEPYFSNRDIFVSQEEKAAAATLVAAGMPPVPIVQWGDGYQLAGVIVDQNPSAIIKTANPPGVVTIAVGQSLGDAVLKKVQDGQAVFDYQNQEIVLKMSEAPSAVAEVK